jgi:hypothetical protein
MIRQFILLLVIIFASSQKTWGQGNEQTLLDYTEHSKQHNFSVQIFTNRSLEGFEKGIYKISYGNPDQAKEGILSEIQLARLKAAIKNQISAEKEIKKKKPRLPYCDFTFKFKSELSKNEFGGCFSAEKDSINQFSSKLKQILLLKDDRKAF